MNDRIAAAQLASMLLALVAVLLCARAPRAARGCASPAAAAAPPHAQRSAHRCACTASRRWRSLAAVRAAGAARLRAAGAVLARDAVARGGRQPTSACRSVASPAGPGPACGSPRWPRCWPTLLALALGFALRRRAATAARSAAASAARVAVARLRGAGRGDRGRHPAAGWPGCRRAGRPAASRRCSPARVLGLLYAYLVRFSAVALQSVEAGYARMPIADRRDRAHARRRPRRACSRGCTCRCCGARRWPRRCWCSST